MENQTAEKLAQGWAKLFTHGAEIDAIVDEIIAPNFYSHSLPHGVPQGPEGVKLYAGIFHTAFPDDLASTVQDVIVQGDKVVERFTGSGTQTGEFFGAPPSGKFGGTTGINIFRVENGKIAEHWSNSDDLGMMMQLGLVAMAQPA